MIKQKFRIEKCKVEFISSLQKFIENYWSKTHILAKNLDFLEWQHQGNSSSHLNFYLAFNDNKSIEGMLGFISTDRYDNTLGREKNLWITTWKVNPNSKIMGLGLLLLNHLIKSENPNWIGSLGLNPATIPFYEKLKFTTGILDHYFILNPRLKSFHIYSGPIPSEDYQESSYVSLKAIESILMLSEKDFLRNDVFPRKSLRYFVERYQFHPIFKYHFYTYLSKSKLNLFVFRFDQTEKAKVLRLVDFYGDYEVLFSASKSLVELIIDLGVEYIDLYIHLSHYVNFSKYGWTNIKDTNVVVPNYFSPFENKNVDIYFAYKGASAVFLKGDSDQDRPN